MLSSLLFTLIGGNVYSKYRNGYNNNLIQDTLCLLESPCTALLPTVLYRPILQGKSICLVRHVTEIASGVGGAKKPNKTCPSCD